MYRVIAIVCGGLALAACSSTSDWMNLDALKPAPIMDTVRFESTPPGADAKTSNGQTCRTPCALALPTNAPLTVAFSLNGYQPEFGRYRTGFLRLRSAGIAAQPGDGRVDACAAAAQGAEETSAQDEEDSRRQACGEAKPKAKPKTSTAPAPARRGRRRRSKRPRLGRLRLRQGSNARPAFGIDRTAAIMRSAGTRLRRVGWTLWPLSATIPISEGRRPPRKDRIWLRPTAYPHLRSIAPASARARWSTRFVAPSPICASR